MEKYCNWEMNNIMSTTIVECKQKHFIGMMAQIREFKYCPYCGLKIKIQE